MKAKGHRWVGLRQNEDSCSKVLECSDPLLIVMPKMRSADGKITVPPYDGGCAGDLGDKMFINSLDLGLVGSGLGHEKGPVSGKSWKRQEVDPALATRHTPPC